MSMLWEKKQEENVRKLVPFKIHLSRELNEVRESFIMNIWETVFHTE